MVTAWVDITGYVDFDVEQYGINEKVSFKVLKDILETSADAEEIEENVKKKELTSLFQNTLFSMTFTLRSAIF